MKKPNITGIIHSIILFVDSWVSLVAGMVVIFCISHIDAPTRMGRTMGDGSGSAKFSQRNLLSRGTT